ncbi:glycosyl hydrolase [Plebeiibacterium marinum]|uniref:Glycosyl hydrolase n=1 Tax=Plebeiibacterium marinum TaxID=2992111 RepID=A0AAE3MEN3_9BACT|nr:glycosyl hydrolase [Plebeiobacterium marinum]MCW3806366.1 glycosyl hydrolase [Plebeiobacterium marinum]
MNKILGLLIFLVLASCTGESGGEEHEPPMLKTSTPENGATGITLDTQVEIVFDEVISLVQNHGITINGELADVSSSLTKLKLDVSLEYNTTYEIIIPAGAVINTFNVPLAGKIQLSFSTIEETIINIKTSLVTQNPSPEAINVYGFLKDNYGVKTISAVHANVAWNCNEAEWVKEQTGKYPAMTTVDYVHLPASPANWIDYSQTSFVEDWWSNNGIVCANWHWIVPRYQGDTDTNNFTYKPEETIFSAENILVDGTWENEVAMADLEKLAGYLLLLKEKNIPVIWRPLHEASGNIYNYANGKAWFWWGDSGASVYKDLWKLMFSYFKDKGLNNLIWVWTTQTNDDAFYPGDEYVDIIGRDIYNTGDAEEIASQFTEIQKIYTDKIVTLSEMGSVSEMSSQWGKGAQWSYFMPWYDYARTNDPGEADFQETAHEHANASWWQNAMQQDFVITRDMMPSLK